MATVKTTLEMSERLFRRAKAAASLRGQSLKQLVTRAIERELQIADRPRPGGAAAVLRGVRTLAAGNAARWKTGPDAVEAVREQRR